MTAESDFIRRISEKLPDDCSTDDLVKAGLYKTRKTAEFQRSNNSGPSYYKLGRKVFYPKELVIAWIESGHHDSAKSFEDSKKAKASESV
jgi:hypothetical protein